MQKLKNMQFNSRAVSRILIAIIALLVIGTGTGSWFMQSKLSAQVIATDHAKIDADLSQTELQRSKTLEAYFVQNRKAIDKAAAIVSDTKTYQYQNQIVNDMQTYAGKAGVTILGYTFPESTVTTAPDATGLKSVPATLTLKSPLAYNSFLLFLKYIEQNVTRMQVTDLRLEPATTDGNTLQNVSITLKVYVR